MKTKAGRRQIPLATQLRKALIEWQLASTYTDPSDFVITTASGSSVSHRNTPRAVTEIALAFGINGEEKSEERPNLDCHSLRHVFGSAMVKATKRGCRTGPGLDGSQRHENTPALLLA